MNLQHEYDKRMREAREQLRKARLYGWLAFGFAAVALVLGAELLVRHYAGS